MSTCVSRTDAAQTTAKRWPVALTTCCSRRTWAEGTVAQRRPSKALQGARTSWGRIARSCATSAAVLEYGVLPTIQATKGLEMR